jgi:heat shock protein HslJ
VSRLWSRFGVRALAVLLLLVGVAGGYYLGEDRQTQQQGFDAQVAADVAQTENEYLKDRQAAYLLAAARRRAAEQDAAKKAAEAAKAEAERARKAEEASRRKRAQAGTTVPYTGPIPASCNEYSGNRKIGCALLLDSGFALAEMPCLDKLWSKESGWNHKARNSSSGAYGIPQALPGSKMGSVASDWRTNPATQIKWGLGYIKNVYGSPCNAWGHEEADGWY